MQYTIDRSNSPLGTPSADWDSPLWTTAETLEITNFPWPDSGHRPRTQARLLYDAGFLAIIFRVEDHYVRAVAERFQDSVCTDSCVEFFVSPLPDSDVYFNFEANCGGTMLLYRCASRDETVPVSAEDGATITMATTMARIVEPEISDPTTWTVEYHIPFGLFATYFSAPPPASGTQWRANFYKCGDRTSHPHWGSWAPVETERPSFHQPGYFRPILFA